MKISGSMIAYEIMLEYQREKKFKHFIEKRKKNEERLKEKGKIRINE